MKKLILSIAAIAIFGFTSCSSDDDGGKSCEQLAADVSVAAQAYGESQTEANCNDYKSSLEAYVAQDCEGSSQYAELIASLDCSQG
ncbi:MAG: hypothetical protein WD554_06440 [Flavobacteriaceae bacterium]